MRKLPIFIVALIVATGAFWATMLTTPPKTEAAQPGASININDIIVQSGLPLAEPTDAF